MKEVWRHEEKMFYLGIGDLFFTQQLAEFIGSGLAILGCIVGESRDSCELCKNLATGVYGVGTPDFFWGRGSESGSEPYEFGPAFNSAIPDRKRVEQKRVIVRYTSTEILLVDHVEKPKFRKHGRFRALLNT